MMSSKYNFLLVQRLILTYQFDYSFIFCVLFPCCNLCYFVCTHLISLNFIFISTHPIASGNNLGSVGHCVKYFNICVCSIILYLLENFTQYELCGKAYLYYYVHLQISIPVLHTGSTYLRLCPFITSVMCMTVSSFFSWQHCCSEPHSMWSLEQSTQHLIAGTKCVCKFTITRYHQLALQDVCSSSDPKIAVLKCSHLVRKLGIVSHFSISPLIIKK